MRTRWIPVLVLVAAGAVLAFVVPKADHEPERPRLAVLYAGKPDSPRTERFRAFLEPWVARVETISLSDLDAEAAAPFDVVVADWERRYGEDGYQSPEPHRKALGREFPTPVVMIGAVAGELVKSWSKIHWL